MFDITMIGSSIFEFWGKPQWGNLNVSNNAIRSTQSQDWLNHDLTTLPSASHILIYCGSNDLIFGNQPEIIVSNICLLLDKLAMQFPNVTLGYFSIMACPQKCAAGQIETINNINLSIKQFCADKYAYFNFNDYIANDALWFIDDGLHLTEQAYLMLNKKLTPVLSQWVSQIK